MTDEIEEARKQLGIDGYVSGPDGFLEPLPLAEAVRILQAQRSAEADWADECQRDRRVSDDLIRRADALLFDLLGRLAINGVDLPATASADLEQWIVDSREAINRSLE